jgi:iron(III) transport system permease protein
MREFNWHFGVLAAIVAMFSATIIGLLAFVVLMSFSQTEHGMLTGVLTLQNYRELFEDPTVGRAAWNTVVFSAASMVIAACFGLPLAWLIERTNLRGRNVLAAMMTIGLLVPGFFSAMGWVLMLHPRIGMINQYLISWFGFANGPLPVTSIGGMAWVEGLTLAPIFYLMTASSLRSMDGSLEEAAYMAGASRWSVARRIQIPLFLPGILAASIFTFTTALGAFDVPGTIGLSARILTFSTLLYVKVSAVENLPNYGLPAAFGSCMLVVAIILSLAYLRLLKRAHAFQVVTGKAWKPRISRLGRLAIAGWTFAALYISLALFIPLLLVAWSALLPFYQPPSMRALSLVSTAAFYKVPWQLVLTGLANSLLIAVIAPTLSLAGSLAFSWIILRSRVRGRLVLDGIAFLPHAVPGIIFALGAVLVALFALPQAIPLYGSMAIIILVNAVGWISFGTRVVNTALMQIHSELEESGLVCGASHFQTLRKILLPLLWPALAGAWIWLALLALRELTRAVILVTGSNVTLPVVTWSLWNGGQLNLAAVIVLVNIVLFAPILIAYFRFTGRSREA